jgi:hypothetical protein
LITDLIYVNDILDENGEISSNFILNRLNNKSNWITVFTIMKKAIPKDWVDIIKTENFQKSVVNILNISREIRQSVTNEDQLGDKNKR